MRLKKVFIRRPPSGQGCLACCRRNSSVPSAPENRNRNRRAVPAVRTSRRRGTERQQRPAPAGEVADRRVEAGDPRDAPSVRKQVHVVPGVVGGEPVRREPPPAWSVRTSRSRRRRHVHGACRPPGVPQESARQAQIAGAGRPPPAIPKRKMRRSRLHRVYSLTSREGSQCPRSGSEPACPSTSVAPGALGAFPAPSTPAEPITARSYRTSEDSRLLLHLRHRPRLPGTASANRFR
jgi:hypothetical protein